MVVVKLTDNDYVGREIRTSVSYKTLENWYSESNAVKSVIESECFAYVEDKLCVATSECLERTDDGKIRLTEYAKTHEEECFLQFIVDENLSGSLKLGFTFLVGCLDCGFNFVYGYGI